jgi:hypothetical protein
MEQNYLGADSKAIHSLLALLPARRAVNESDAHPADEIAHSRTHSDTHRGRDLRARSG